MKLEGSCHCGAVSFTVDSKTPYPYMHCYCGMCRKTNGGTGATINLCASADTLDVQGIENVSIYRVRTFTTLTTDLLSMLLDYRAALACSAT